MGHAAGESPERRQLLGVEQLVGQRLALGDVYRLELVRPRAVRQPDGRGAEQDPGVRAVRSYNFV